MLLYWLYPLVSSITFLNIFRYITFRTMGAIFTAFLLSFFFGNRFILWLKKKQVHGQPIRLDGPESHLTTKKGTPTMGGGLILFALTVSTLLWMDISNTWTWIALLGTLGFGLLGAYDDYTKLTKRSHHGISASLKLFGQIALSLIISVLLTQSCNLPTTLTIPFLKELSLDLGFFFLCWSCFVIVGTSNAVNLTDGLDGLAIVPVMITAACFALIAYLVGNKIFSQYLKLYHVAQAGELSIFLGALVGSGLGFLWFNAPPAKVFMGDTGSLSSGAALGIVGVMTKHEIVLAIIGGLFVMEAISVIGQVLSFKMTRKRIFLMAPIHHHFEKKGWPESTVVIRFWTISVLLALLGLSTLKLR